MEDMDKAYNAMIKANKKAEFAAFICGVTTGVVIVIAIILLGLRHYHFL